MKIKPWLVVVLLLLITVPLVDSIAASSSMQFATSTQDMWQSEEARSKNPPYIKESTACGAMEYPKFDTWLRDKNRNKMDDLIENQTGSFNIFIHYDHHPTTSDVALLSSYVIISHTYNYIATIAARNVPKNMIETLSKLPHVTMIEWQGFTKLTLDVSVPAVRARQSAEYSPNTAWDLGYNGSGVTIAILDTGVDNEHESFTGKFVAGYDATTGIAGDPDDTDGHGTHVAGTALGTGGPSQTYAGVAPGAMLVDVKVLTGETGSSDDIIEGIEWVINNRATYNIRIMSISIAITYENGTEIPSDGTDSVSQAVNNAVDAGIVVVAAVGNSGQNIIPAPAAADEAIAVGAIDDWTTITRDDDTIAWFSNYGPRLDDGDADQIDELKPDVVAPGVLIMAPRVNTTNQYWDFDQDGFSWSGTSMATPHVSGIVALMLEKEPNLTPALVKDILHQTADDRNGTYNPSLDPKYDENYGWGLADAYEAVELAVTSWERVIISLHFSVYYNITGQHGTTDEYAQTVSYAFEHSWTTIVTNLGFNPPPDSHITAYLEDLTSPLLGKMSAYYNPTTGWHVEFIKIDIGMETGLAKVTATHEFFHTVQLSYDPTEEDWIIEGTAKWSESKVYPEYVGSSSYVEYVNSYMSNPDRALPQLSYEAVLFWIFVDEHYGTSTIDNVLQQTTSKDGIYAVDVALSTLSTSFVEVFKEWTIANYFKDLYYSKGQLFNTISATQLTYSGGRIDYDRNVIDWGADYYVISSSVIYMPMQFTGGQHHNLTKILIEHGTPLISDLVLFIPYSGSFWLMQANNLDKIVIIVRSLGTETSSDRTAYTLTLLSSSYSLEGQYTLTSTSSTLYVKNSKGWQSSRQINSTIVDASSHQDSSVKTLYTISGSGSQNSPQTNATTVDASSSQKSSPQPLFALNNTGSQNSSSKPVATVSSSSTTGSSPTPVAVEPMRPIASFTYRPPLPVVNQTVTFDASNSTPNGGNIISYQWDFGDNSSGEGIIATHIYTSIGNYTVTLNVTDSEGMWSTTSRTIRIYETGILSIDIINLTITDQNGNPKTNFNRGNVVQFNFTVENVGNIDLKKGLISVMILDPSNTPIFLSYTFEDINSGASKEFIIGYMIPLDGPIGTHTVKIMVLTDWPSEGGVGLAIETSTFNVS